ncbi:hypothetical protein IP92_02221 [Pseudoduganella flava]|uniref:Uncharacterized protein n=1 Tax=Pseudoduganella flava TaxID=871742 RepID=A0A562PWR5_9BURK|nr:hypothetical protein [Pseudoduganella flava]QGZ39895.1 hypothetical protein GO485_13100 [Pseudoduganella flava]TWI48828.1 hypothetical protein IP92_02221 [Pseudoduganella flava]
MALFRLRGRYGRAAALVFTILGPIPALLGGCADLSVAQRAGVGIGTAALAVSPSAEVEQTYYLGSFDPQEQLPPAVYRIRVRGQSSVLNATKFASSWVPAEVVDSLNRNISFTGKTSDVGYGSGGDASDLKDAGRGLVVFGPEGFREAPRGHRLVIIMGSSPETVEQAFSSALGTVAQVRYGDTGAELDRTMFARLTVLHSDKERLRVLTRQP